MTMRSKVKVFRIGPTAGNMNFCIFLVEVLSMQMTYIYYQVVLVLVPLLLLFRWMIFMFAIVFV